jgi:GDP-fucose transporter C1
MHNSKLTIFLTIGAAVLFYWFVSISLVFLNKYLLSSPDLKLDAPLFITWFQCLVAVFILGALLVAPNYGVPIPEKYRIPATPRPQLITACLETLPLSIAFVMMTSGNNMMLKYVPVSFYYIGRSLTIVFNTALTFAILGDRTSLAAIGCLALIIIGFFCGVDQEGAAGSLNLTGLGYGIFASLMVAVTGILQKKYLKIPSIGDNEARLTLVNNVNATFLFLPLMLLWGEFGRVAAFDLLFSFRFVSAMLVASVFGVGMAYMSVYCISLTSPLSHNVSGTVKSAIQTVLGVAFFNEWAMRSLLWWGSNFTIVGASIAYAVVRWREMHDKKSPTPAPIPSDERPPEDETEKARPTV